MNFDFDSLKSIALNQVTTSYLTWGEDMADGRRKQGGKIRCVAYNGLRNSVPSSTMKLNILCMFLEEYWVYIITKLS